jgi:hypothetical protein
VSDSWSYFPLDLNETHLVVSSCVDSVTVTFDTTSMRMMNSSISPNIRVHPLNEEWLSVGRRLPRRHRPVLTIILELSTCASSQRE